MRNGSPAGLSLWVIAAAFLLPIVAALAFFVVVLKVELAFAVVLVVGVIIAAAATALGTHRRRS